MPEYLLPFMGVKCFYGLIYGFWKPCPHGIRMGQWGSKGGKLEACRGGIQGLGPAWKCVCGGGGVGGVCFLVPRSVALVYEEQASYGAAELSVGGQDTLDKSPRGCKPHRGKGVQSQRKGVGGNGISYRGLSHPGRGEVRPTQNKIQWESGGWKSGLSPQAAHKQAHD